MRSSALSLCSIASVAAFAAAVSIQGSASAQDAGPSLDLRGFHAPTDPASGLYTEPASSPDTFEWNVGLWLLYVDRPLTLRDPTTDEIRFDVISHQLTGDVTASVGFARRFALGLDFPFLLSQSGDEPTSESRRVLGETALPRDGLGDLGITGKLTLIPPAASELGGFALALHERFTVPTGSEASFIGEGSVTSETRVLAEYRLVALGLHASTGVKIRGEGERFACAATPPPALEGEADLCPTRFQHEIPFGLGVSLRPQALGIDDAGRWTWFVEAHGHVPLAPIGPFSSGSSRIASLELNAAARLALGDISILAGLGWPLLSSIGGGPVRGVLSVGWAPRVHDADKDGVEDSKDRCRELPEDRDGFQDEDGCPDTDNDDDGVPDDDDKCSGAREDEDGFEDDDGCPDIDNDADSIPDTSDACPDEAGVASADPAKKGCPVRDADGDGIEGSKDECLEAAEDKDNFEDDDGCPEADNDDDDIPDEVDACPNVAGVDSPNAKERGCPDRDRDRDTFLDADDKCPGEAEVWNGLDDADGCPDGDPKKKLKPLVAIADGKDGAVLAVAGPVKLTEKAAIEPASEPTIRAIASELLKNRGWTVVVGVRPKPKGGEDEAKGRAAVIVDAIRRYTRNEASASAVGWAEVKDVPGAAALGIGFKLNPIGSKAPSGSTRPPSP